MHSRNNDSVEQVSGGAGGHDGGVDPTDRVDPTGHFDPASVANQMRDVIYCEADALRQVATRIHPNVANAVRLLLHCKGRVIVTGMGKMGWVARKAAATFCSTGTPAIFLHPSEALHGDVGIVSETDVLLALSNSGETDEVVGLLPYMHRIGVPIISLTGNTKSSLAQRSAIPIDVGVDQEADPISMAPTSSTTVAMAMCDALAVALMHQRGFTKEQFAIFHPGGNLGRKLLLTVSDLMHRGDSIPAVEANASLRNAIVHISEKGLGAVFVVDRARQVQGIITDGDLRRIFEHESNPLEDQVQVHMTKRPRTVSNEALAAEALRLMEDQQITVLPVVDKRQNLVGAVHLHDLVRAGLA